MERRRRIGAYGVCLDADGRVLLMRTSARSVRPGMWYLPGGGIDQGEHPADAVVREMAQETGLTVAISGLRDVAAEVVARPSGLEHTDAVIYNVAVTGGTLRVAPDGFADEVRWVPAAELPTLTLSRFAAHALGLAPPTSEPQPPVEPTAPAPGTGPRQPVPRPRRGQRFGAYGVVTDPDDRVLLTLIAEGYPGAGRWHLPGGGTDFGEQPADGLLREITEESGQTGRIVGLLTVAHTHNPAALGPEGYPIDWHSVRAVFKVAVDHPTSPHVLDQGGSTADAAWFTRDEAAAMSLTDVAAAMLTRSSQPRA